MSYLEDRLYKELRISPEQNSIQVIVKDRFGMEIRKDVPIFTSTREDDIEILVYTLDRRLITYDHPAADPNHADINNQREQHFHITRLNPARIGADGNKYRLPKGKGTFPFLPPMIIDAYEKKQQFDTLYLTEGYFKAFKASIHGLHIIGLSSITHYANARTKKIHPAIAQVIEACKVKNVVMLYDGDCLNISTKAIGKKDDLAKRPNGFLSSMINVRELLIDFDVKVWFSHINSVDLRNEPKGLDDLLVEYAGQEAEIIDDLNRLDKNSQFVIRRNVSAGCKLLQGYFNLKNVEQFYGAWEELIGESEFVFYGSTYRKNPKSGKVEKTMPKELKNFIRVGDDYYEMVEIPIISGTDEINLEADKEIKLYKRRKSTLVDDFGKELVTKIPKFKAFINMPSHINFQQIVDNCWNSYYPINHAPERGEWPTIERLLRHIFGEQYEIGLDYLQILWQYPTHILPILCLVSQERQTGKTTFLDFLKMVFGGNMAKVGNSEVSSQFNSFLTSKLIVGVDETNLEKNRDMTERIKMLSTTTRIFSQAKGVDYVEQYYFTKFILTSNFETNFIFTQEDEIRFWVRKIPHLDNVIPTLLSDLYDEIPAFLYDLQNRKISKPKTSRMWFDPADLETDALRKLKEKQKPLVEREIAAYMHDLFLDFPADSYLFTIEALQQRIPMLQKKDSQTLNTTLRENMKLAKYMRDGKEVPTRFKIPRWRQGDGDGLLPEIEFDRYHGRPYVFPADKFLTASELEQIKQPEEMPEREYKQIELPY